MCNEHENLVPLMDIHLHPELHDADARRALDSFLYHLDYTPVAYSEHVHWEIVYSLESVLEEMGRDSDIDTGSVCTNYWQNPDIEDYEVTYRLRNNPLERHTLSGNAVRLVYNTEEFFDSTEQQIIYATECGYMYDNEKHEIVAVPL